MILPVRLMALFGDVHKAAEDGYHRVSKKFLRKNLCFNKALHKSQNSDIHHLFHYKRHHPKPF